MITDPSVNEKLFDNSGLHHLAEAAITLTERIQKSPEANECKRTCAISEDEEQASIVVEADTKICQELVTPNISPENASANSRKQIFPSRLMQILSQKSLSEIIRWLPHGKSFVIIRPNVLAEKILPAFFPESLGSLSEKTSRAQNGSVCKYPSFTRKLNRWGFRQISKGVDAGAFHHKLFQRDLPKLCLQMVCQRSRRHKSEKKSNVKSVAETEKAHKKKRTERGPSLSTVSNNSKRKVIRGGSFVTDSESDSSSNGAFKSLPPKKRKHIVCEKRNEVSRNDSDKKLTTQAPVHSPNTSLSSTSSAISSVGTDTEYKSSLIASNTSCSPSQLPPKTYLDESALIQHNIAINNINSLNAAIVMAAQVSAQHQSLPNLPTLFKCANLAVLANSVSTQLQNCNCPTTSTTISKNNSTTSTERNQTSTHRIPDTTTKSIEAQKRITDAKSMLYDAYLKALK